MMANILVRSKKLVNYDPQKRCYNGAYADARWEWDEWYILEWEVKEADKRIQFWKELNDYAVSQRGEDARREFKVEE